MVNDDDYWVGYAHRHLAADDDARHDMQDYGSVYEGNAPIQDLRGAGS